MHKFIAKLLSEYSPKIIVELQDGTEIPVQKIYHVGGRAECIKVLILDKEKDDFLRKIRELEHDYKVSEDEKDNAESELENAEKQLAEIEEKHENYLQNIDSALENVEEILEIKTSSRNSYDRIDELAEKIKSEFDFLNEEREKLEERIRELEVDNKALTWNIEQLENWKENTIKDEKTNPPDSSYSS